MNKNRLESQISDLQYMINKMNQRRNNLLVLLSSKQTKLNDKDE